LIPGYRLSNGWLLGVAATLFLGAGRFLSLALWGSLPFPAFDFSPTSELTLDYWTTLTQRSLWDVASANALGAYPPLVNFQYGPLEWLWKARLLHDSVLPITRGAVSSTIGQNPMDSCAPTPPRVGTTATRNPSGSTSSQRSVRIARPTRAPRPSPASPRSAADCTRE
jgi:hypothetical protein